jgi:hypothetical protein
MIEFHVGKTLLLVRRMDTQRKKASTYGRFCLSAIDSRLLFFHERFEIVVCALSGKRSLDLKAGSCRSPTTPHPVGDRSTRSAAQLDCQCQACSVHHLFPPATMSDACAPASALAVDMRSRPLRHGQYHHNIITIGAQRPTPLTSMSLLLLRRRVREETKTMMVHRSDCALQDPAKQQRDKAQGIQPTPILRRQHSPKHASKELGQPHSFSVGVAMMHSLGPRLYTGPEITAVKAAHDSLLSSRFCFDNSRPVVRTA